MDSATERYAGGWDPFYRGSPVRPLLTAAITLLSLPLAAAPAFAHGAFWDDDGNTHEASIEAIADRGITRGCDPPVNQQFCPNLDIPRDQMAAFIARAAGWEESNSNAFEDDDGNIFEGYINALADRGITKGCNPPENSHYCPDLDIPRDQMAAFLDRAFVEQEADRDYFVDDERNMFEQHINNIAAADITRGCNPPENDRYCPDRDVPRDEMASFIARAAGFSGSDPTQGGHERVIYYSIAREGNPDQGSFAVFGLRAHQALHSQVTMDEDGWNIQQRIFFVPLTGPGGDFTLHLTDDDDVGEKAAGCSDRYSCTVGDDIFINDQNFAESTDTWDHRSLAAYQRYVINHEVGHWLDFDRAPGSDDSHYNDDRYCDPPGSGDAPVMMQQSIRLYGCQTNAWPLGFERDCVEEAWLSDDTTQDRECPHDPVER